MQLWLIPIFPFIGFLINGLFGRRLTKPVINAVAVGSVALSFLWVLKCIMGAEAPLKNRRSSGTSLGFRVVTSQSAWTSCSTG